MDRFILALRCPLGLTGRPLMSPLILSRPRPLGLRWLSSSISPGGGVARPAAPPAAAKSMARPPRRPGFLLVLLRALGAWGVGAWRHRRGVLRGRP